MAHTKLKSTTELKINFDPSELKFESAPEESKKKAEQYISSDQLADGDIMMFLEDKVIYGYDYLYKGKKLILPEVNPTLIFFSNAIMSSNTLQYYKEVLFNESLEAGKAGKILSLNHSATFFQLSINCVINLQAAIESFANRNIPETYECIDKDGKAFFPNIDYKLYTAIPIVTGKNFGVGKNKKYLKYIMKLIKLRNDIIHLKPLSKTNTGYKVIYRELLNFDFEKTILAIRKYINFYDENLIEECQCGIDFSYDIKKSEL